LSRDLRAWTWLVVSALLLAACGGSSRPSQAAANGVTSGSQATTTVAPAPLGSATPGPTALGSSLSGSPDGIPSGPSSAGTLAAAPPQATSPTPTASPTAAPTDPPAPANTPVPTPTATVAASPTPEPNPLQILSERTQSYPGSDITIEQTLAPGANYSQYIASYRSEGLKIYALLTVPKGSKPPTGWPVIVFNHGYISPVIYRTTERYVAYVAAIANSGYIVFKSDYRGHGSSEGEAVGGYGSTAYTTDILNAVASLKKFPDADPNRIGMWGHSMGGQLTLRAMVISKDIKAGVIWGGVVGTYQDLIENWHHAPLPPSEIPPLSQRRWPQELTAKYGTPEQNPSFWASISPNSYLNDLSGPLQLDHSVTDEEVPVQFSQKLYEQLKAAGKTTELYTYPGDNHNISANLNLAMQRSIAWFDKYVKGS
jgi:uncharacterized protein